MTQVTDSRAVHAYLTAAMSRCKLVPIVVIAILLPLHLYAQTAPAAKAYFQKVGLSSAEIDTVSKGQAVAKNLNTRSASEIFVFGAVFINAAPEAYLTFVDDYARLRKLDEYLAIEGFSTPPTLANLKGFAFNADDIKALKDCKPGDCDIQLPGSAIGTVRATIDWSAPNAADKVNQFLQERTLQRVTQYQKQGTISGLVYNDKKQPTDSLARFKYLLSYKMLPPGLQDFFNYLVSYPKGAPAGTKSQFYWTNVKFGLKPTLRVLHVVIMSRKTPADLAYVIAEKQLYASHYFATALDLTLCYRSQDPKQPGFYLVKVLGSEQDGLTGIKGSIVRKVAVDKSVSSLEKSLNMIKGVLEQR
jgi:hypothetical protein